jgi:hypothetical protein
LIIVNLKGGLGNQLFQYALGWRLAQDTCQPLYLDRRSLLDRMPHKDSFVFRNYDLDLFGIHPIDPTTNMLRRFGLGFSDRRIREVIMRFRNAVPLPWGCFVREHTMRFDSKILNLTGDIYLDGYWQTEKYFIGYENELRERLQVALPLIPEASAILEDINNSEAVCLNVRRTDFVGNQFHDVCDANYFRMAADCVRVQYSKSKFFVFSDDIEWCRKNLNFGFPLVFVGHEMAGPRFSSYFQLMVSCRHFIIPNSTFGWWAAWLSPNFEKVVVAPKKWFGSPAVDASDVVPKSWICL